MSRISSHESDQKVPNGEYDGAISPSVGATILDSYKSNPGQINILPMPIYWFHRQTGYSIIEQNEKRQQTFLSLRASIYPLRLDTRIPPGLKTGWQTERNSVKHCITRSISPSTQPLVKSFKLFDMSSHFLTNQVHYLIVAQSIEPSTFHSTSDIGKWAVCFWTITW